ncbi:DUF6226 family protein [Terrabacter aeriphilus]|uniref:DUF6226 family protein n=1 Tax=Terrabacter aeriphilus TaxID=515662 RepID=UPI003CD06DFD
MSADADDAEVSDPSPAIPPAWLSALVRDVDQAFAVTGAATPGWDDPHPDRSALEEEYSRCSDPGKYRILDARADAWCEVLARQGLAHVTNARGARWMDGVRDPDAWWRVRQLNPSTPGGLTLHLASTLVDGQPFGVDVGVSAATRPAVHLGSVPDCGCDACDSGSAELLDVLDGWILSVAAGGVVHARSDAASISRTAEGGWQADGMGWLESWLDASSPVPRGVRRWIGSPWHVHAH